MQDAPNVLIAYDGSDQATEAITIAARLFGPRARATVLYAWELMYPPLAAGAAPIPTQVVDDAEAKAVRLLQKAHSTRQRRGARSSTLPIATVPTSS
jgi:hypothetical protein